MLPKKHTLLLLLAAVVAIGLTTLSVFRYRSALYLNVQQAPDEQIPEFDLIPISTNDPVLGALNAPITVIGFEDFLCDTCRQQHQFITELVRQYPDQVKFIWKDFSIVTIPQESYRAHEFGYCMNRQDKFAEYQTAIFSTYTTLSDTQLFELSTNAGGDRDTLESCLASGQATAHIERSKLLAQALNLQQAPTFFVNGTQIQTPGSLSEWIMVLNL